MVMYAPGRHRQPDHDEPARRRRSASCKPLWSLYGALVVHRRCVMLVGAARADRDGLSPAAQRGARARSCSFLGVPLDTPAASTAGSAPACVLVVGVGAVRDGAAPLRAQSGAQAQEEIESGDQAAGRPGMTATHSNCKDAAQELRQDRDHPRRQPGGEAGRAHRHHRPQRRRQVDAVQPDQRPPRAHQRRGAAQRPAHRRPDSRSRSTAWACRAASRSPTSSPSCRCSRTCAAGCCGAWATATRSGSSSPNLRRRQRARRGAAAT